MRRGAFCHLAEGRGRGAQAPPTVSDVVMDRGVTAQGQPIQTAPDMAAQDGLASVASAGGDQAPAVAAAAVSHRRIPHVIAITSGKGGVGKSSIAVNLGLALARGGSRVCIFDADTGLANINILLGLTPRMTLEHVLFGSKTIEEIMLEAPYGMKVVPGANGISECATLQGRQQLRLTRELARIETAFDYLLLDTAAGIADDTLEFVTAAHHALIVITPEPTSLTDAFSLVKLMARRRRGISVQVVVNMCPNLIAGREIFQRFQTAVKKYVGVEVHPLGYLLRDESLRNAVTLQQPVALFPESDPSCRGFLRLAESLQRTVATTSPRLAFSSYWQRRFQSRQPQAPATAAPGAEIVLSVEALREQLLTLIEQEVAPTPELARLFDTALAAFFSRHPAADLELAPLLARLAERTEPGDATLRRRVEALAPAVLASSDESLGSAPDFVPPLSIQSGDKLSARSSQPLRGHGYDPRCFGSQERLVQQLQTLGDDANVTEWLGGLTATRQNSPD